MSNTDDIIEAIKRVSSAPHHPDDLAQLGIALLRGGYVPGFLPTKPVETDYPDACQRCGADVGDLRTIWVECWYLLTENSPIPWRHVQIHGRFQKQIAWKDGFMGPLPVYEKKGGKIQDWHFYQVTVCKWCRGDFMIGMKDWWKNKPRYCPICDEYDEGNGCLCDEMIRSDI